MPQTAQAEQRVKPGVFKFAYLRAEDEQRKLRSKRHQDTEHLVSSRG